MEGAYNENLTLNVHVDICFHFFSTQVRGMATLKESKYST